MPTYNVSLLAIIALAVFALAVYIYLQSRPPAGLKNPSPSRVKPCKWDPRTRTYEENHDCSKACGGPPYTLNQLPVSNTKNGQTWLYCCPPGYTVRITDIDEYCEKD